MHSGSSRVKRAKRVMPLLLATIVTMSWQTSLRAQAVARVGVVVSDLTEAEGRDLGLPDSGVFVIDVRNGTSAARAGIIAKDIIFELDGGPIHGLADFICRVSRKRPDDFIKFHILRNLKPLVITVSLGTWPSELLSSRSPTVCGIVGERRAAYRFNSAGRMARLDFDGSEVKLGLIHFRLDELICFDRSRTENPKSLQARSRREPDDRAEAPSISRL